MAKKIQIKYPNVMITLGLIMFVAVALLNGRISIPEAIYAPVAIVGAILVVVGAMLRRKMYGKESEPSRRRRNLFF